MYKQHFFSTNEPSPSLKKVIKLIINTSQKFGETPPERQCYKLLPYDLHFVPVLSVLVPGKEHYHQKQD